jgi:hypothetical protein
VPGAFVQAHDPRSGFHAIFEDDGRVAYAYLLNPAKKIVSDVWLYNVGPAPESHAGERRGEPVRNLAKFASSDDFEPVVDGEVSFEWTSRPEGEAEVSVFLRGERFARLESTSKPGWSRLAKKDGPVARVLA